MQVIDENKQSEIALLMDQIGTSIDKINAIFDTMSTKDRLMVGGIALGIYSPWTDVEDFMFVGSHIILPAVINRMVGKFNQGLMGAMKEPPQSPFSNIKKEEFH